ncbi:MAG: thioesterase family protein [Chitinophagales bacterium]|nr:thioesterase family protein [Chitinophagales bacterium]MCZ2392732.1 thioesterase family protein [Chitinophagales bacterium]
MKKEKIFFPETTLWRTRKVIAEQDINFAQHMGNERILVWADEIRTQFLTHIGWDIQCASDKIGIIVANHTIVYQSEGFLGDEILIEVGIDYLKECSFDMIIRCRKEGAQKNMVIIRTGIVCFNYEQREIVRVPNQFIEFLKGKINIT